MNNDKILIVNNKTVYFTENNKPYIKTEKRRIYGYILTCKNCNNKFFTQKKYSNCCSQKCKGEYLSNKQIVYCDYCHKEITKYPCQIYKHNFCSLKCHGQWLSLNQKKENNPMWNGGKVIVYCDYCGEQLERNPSNIFDYNFCSKICKGKWMSKNTIGEKSYNWKGGRLSISRAFRGDMKYHDWRTSCMARDNFTCQECGKKDCMLNVHHIKPVAQIFDEYNLQTRDDYMNCDELWDMNNGITLCEKCHKEIHRRT